MQLDDLTYMNKVFLFMIVVFVCIVGAFLIVSFYLAVAVFLTLFMICNLIYQSAELLTKKKNKKGY